jgi:hypothetical protein
MCWTLLYLYYCANERDVRARGVREASTWKCYSGQLGGRVFAVFHHDLKQ